nr:MAG TPA: hypothetical protein [Caudoviricetes sp.]
MQPYRRTARGQVRFPNLHALSDPMTRSGR